MPHKTSIKFDVSVNNHSAKPAAPEGMSDSYMPVSKKIEPNKEWQRIVIDAGDRDSIDLFLIYADKYENKTCPSKKPSIFFRFVKRDGDPKLKKWVGTPNDNSLALEGPILLTGFTTSLLPDVLEGVAVKNMLNEAITIEILVAKTEKDAMEEDECVPTPAPQMAAVARR